LEETLREKGKVVIVAIMTEKLALILSGGGARGAYEVGILAWIAEHRPELLERVRIITGASVGALNAAYLASHGLTPDAVEGLAHIWRTLRMDSLIGFSMRRVLRRLVSRGWKVFDREDPKRLGLLQTEGYEALIRRAVDWDKLAEVTRSGRFDGLAIAATAIQTGRTHVFVQHAPEIPVPTWPTDGSMVGWDGPIRPEHIIASASLPFLFPPVRIGPHWYCDGGLRQNTPLSPALRLGATQLFAISVKTRPAPPNDLPDEFPGFGILLGKLFNSIFLDRLLWDLDRLSRINTVLDCAEEIGGAAMIPKLQKALVKRGRRAYTRVAYVGVQPSADIGAVAAGLLERPHQLQSELSFFMRKVLGGGPGGVSDAASYLLFDGSYGDALIELGRRDGANYADDIDTLLAAGNA